MDKRGHSTYPVNFLLTPPPPLLVHVVVECPLTPRRPPYVMGASYSFEINSIETYATQFFEHNDSFLGMVKLSSYIGALQNVVF